MTEGAITNLGFKVVLNTDFESAIQRVTEALKAEGFGVLTEIDVKATLKKKLDVDFRPYKILGACNPSLAHRALTIDPQVGLLLPCNVVISQIEGGSVEVSLVDPISMLGIVKSSELEVVAEEARLRLQRVTAFLQNSE
ncbi:MAG TPA: DUF302 domain-containing protein [Anaerolineales bacterium]|nr:DUF302 domain-containing protein [Anaerolineales bacterium]